MTHPQNIKGYSGSLEELATAIGNLEYSSVELFLGELSKDIERQADADTRKGRRKLSGKLYDVARGLDYARRQMSEAWKICEPYMKDERKAAN